MSIYHNPNDKLYYYCVLCGYNSTPNQLLAHIRSRHKTLNAEKRPDVHQLIADRIDYCRQLNANLTAANGSAIQSLPANNVHQLLAAGEGCMTCDSIVGFYRLDAWSAAKPLNKCGCGQKKPGLVECTRCQNRFHWSCHEKVPISGYAGHDFGAYLCKYCRSRDFMIIGRNHLSPHELLLHLRLHYHYAPLKCLGCMDRFPGYAALRLHIQARHGNSKLAIDKGCNTLWSFEPIAELEALIAKAGIDSRLDFIAHTSSPIVVGNVSLREALLSTASGNTLSATTPSSSSTTASPALVDLTDEPNSPPPVIPATVTSAPAVNIQPAQHIYFINTLTSATGHLLYTNIAQQTPSASNVGPTLASNVGQSLAARLTHSLGLQNVAPPSQATNAVQSIPQYNVIKNIPPRLAKVIVTVKQLSDLNLFNGGGADQAFNFFTKHLIQIEKLCHALNVTNQMKQTVYTLLSTALSIPMADLMQRTASAYSEHMIHKNRTHIKKLVDQLIVRTAFTSQKTAQEFQFTEDLVKLLNITYFYKMKQYFRLKIDNPAPDEYLLNFLSNAILPLWSTGNMTCQRLIQNVDSRELKRLFSPLTESQSAAQEVSIGSAPVSVNVSPAAAVVSDAEVIDLSFDSGDEEVAGEQQASEAEAVVNVAVNEIPIETIGEPMNESIAVMNDSLDVSMDTTNDPLNQSMEVTHEEADTVSAVAATADSSPIRVQKFKRLCIKLGHISCVYCIKFDTTGRYVFTGSDDYLIKVWSTLDGRLVATLRGHEHEITDIAVSHDNSLLATGDINYLIFIWCLKSARALQVLKAHTKQITSLAFCPLTQTTASYLVSTGDDGRVCFWRFDSQSRAFNATPDPEIIEQHSKKSGISCSSFSAGGHLLAVGSTDSYITIYAVDNTTGPQKMLSMKYHWGHVDRIHFSHNSLRFVSSSNNVFSDKDIDKDNAFIWHMVDNSWAVIPIKVYLQIGDTRYNYKTLIHEMEWTPDDQYVVTSLTDYSIKIWNSTDGQLLHVLSGHDDEIHVIQCHPTLPHIFLSAGYDAKAILWDLTKGRPLKTFTNKKGRAILDASFSPDGRMLATADCYGRFALYGAGDLEPYLSVPSQLFFHSDYHPMLKTNHKLKYVDKLTELEPHLLPVPFLVNIDGAPHPSCAQRLVPGREDTRHYQNDQFVCLKDNNKFILTPVTDVNDTPPEPIFADKVKHLTEILAKHTTASNVFDILFINYIKLLMKKKDPIPFTQFFEILVKYLVSNMTVEEFQFELNLVVGCPEADLMVPVLEYWLPYFKPKSQTEIFSNTAISQETKDRLLMGINRKGGEDMAGDDEPEFVSKPIVLMYSTFSLLSIDFVSKHSVYTTDEPSRKDINECGVYLSLILLFSSIQPQSICNKVHGLVQRLINDTIKVDDFMSKVTDLLELEIRTGITSDLLKQTLPELRYVLSKNMASLEGITIGPLPASKSVSRLNRGQPSEHDYFDARYEDSSDKRTLYLRDKRKCKGAFKELYWKVANKQLRRRPGHWVSYDFDATLDTVWGDAGRSAVDQLTVDELNAVYDQLKRREMSEIELFQEFRNEVLSAAPQKVSADTMADIKGVRSAADMKASAGVSEMSHYSQPDSPAPSAASSSAQSMTSRGSSGAKRVLRTRPRESGETPSKRVRRSERRLSSRRLNPKLEAIAESEAPIDGHNNSNLSAVITPPETVTSSAIDSTVNSVDDSYEVTDTASEAPQTPSPPPSVYSPPPSPPPQTPSPPPSAESPPAPQMASCGTNTTTTTLQTVEEILPNVDDLDLIVDEKPIDLTLCPKACETQTQTTFQEFMRDSETQTDPQFDIKPVIKHEIKTEIKAEHQFQYLCIFCKTGRQFADRKEAYDHYRSHLSVVIRCDECLANFSTAKAFGLHDHNHAKSPKNAVNVRNYRLSTEWIDSYLNYQMTEEFGRLCGRSLVEFCPVCCAVKVTARTNHKAFAQCLAAEDSTTFEEHISAHLLCDHVFECLQCPTVTAAATTATTSTAVDIDSESQKYYFGRTEATKHLMSVHSLRPKPNQSLEEYFLRVTQLSPNLEAFVNRCVVIHNSINVLYETNSIDS